MTFYPASSPDVIRSKIKTFAQQTASATVLRKSDGKAIPPFKLIILDEADSMTNSAQVSVEGLTRVASLARNTIHFHLMY